MAKGRRAKGQLGGSLFLRVPEPEAGIAFRASSVLSPGTGKIKLL